MTFNVPDFDGCKFISVVYVKKLIKTATRKFGINGYTLNTLPEH